jgi:hypothetical protein
LQFEVSVWMFTHDPLQLVVPDGQLVTHMAPEQTSLAPQAWPHEPQLPLSLCSLTQTPLQSV